MTTTVTIIGAGKVGEALALAFYRAGISIEKVVSRSYKSAARLAEKVKSSGSTDISAPCTSEFILLTVPDGAINEVCDSLAPAEDSIVMHTAGSFDLDVFKDLRCKGSGVFYPLQTFTSGREIDISIVPFLVEGDSSSTEEQIEELARLISNNISRVGSDKRKMIHLSAVFVCNFINHLLHAGEDIIGKADLPASLLYPLVDETIRKARDIGPADAQTGPASRNDISTIEKHIDLLSFSSELEEIYKAVTRSIIKNKAL